MQHLVNGYFMIRFIEQYDFKVRYYMDVAFGLPKILLQHSLEIIDIF